ncbi:MAG: DUF512 domain-containing protein, partial [Clostridia bacterium]|nr:DUF512 domain-containing protein [Clostridia bacterium]
LKRFTAAEARHTVEEITHWQESCLEFKGSRFIFPSDELYVQAGIPVPPAEEYEGFSQIENGVGLLARFRQEFSETLDDPALPPWIPDRKVSVALGVSAQSFIKGLCETLCDRYPNLTVLVYPITNFFFGESVTVTGLLTGRDIAVQLDGKDLGEETLICDVMLRGENGRFLDDLSVQDVENWINHKIKPTENNGKALIYALLGIE